MSFLKSKTFWLWFVVSAIAIFLLFGWELSLFHFLPKLPRPDTTKNEILFSIILGFLLSLNIGLIMWKRKYGQCPVGIKRATGAAGILGMIGLLCPVCILLPFSIFGLGLSLTFLSPFLPLLRIIAFLLLLISAWIMLKK